MTSEGMDRDLAWTERLGVRAHLLICRDCSSFAQQVQALRAFARALVDHVRPAADRRDE